MKYAIVWTVVIVVMLAIAYTCIVHTRIYLRMTAGYRRDEPSAETTARKDDFPK